MEIRKLSKAFLKDLNYAINSAIETISNVIIHHLDRFSEAFAEYSAKHIQSIHYLTDLRKCINSKTIANRATSTQIKVWDCIRKGEANTLSRRLTFESFLLLPVQRILRYPLLILAIQKNSVAAPQPPPSLLGQPGISSRSSPMATFKTAFELSERVSEVVNHRSGELNNQRKLIELQSRVDWNNLLGIDLHLCSFTRLLGMRRYIREGPMNISSGLGRKRIYAFLLNDLLILTFQWREGHRWLYELYRTPIQTCDIVVRVPSDSSSSSSSSRTLSSTEDLKGLKASDQMPDNIQSFEIVHTRTRESITLRTPDAAKWIKDLIEVSEVHYQAMRDAINQGTIVIEGNGGSKAKKRVLSPTDRDRIRQGYKPSHLGRRH